MLAEEEIKGGIEPPASSRAKPGQERNA